MPFNARTFASLVRSAARLLGQAGSGAGTVSGQGSRDRTGIKSRPGPGRRSPRPSPAPSPGPKAAPSHPRQAAASGATGYAGDYAGPVSPVYAPRPDGDPDPGEVVWAWVPYEEDPAQGKDRPVLLIGRNGALLLGLMMTSRDRNNTGSSDPRYLDVGTGPWDSKGRPSEVKLDRVLRLEPESIRREGAVMDERAFGRVVRALAKVRPAR
ncbi:type II toxin-antitoxin system PemK/MazF family toxin [Arthrobacter sp. zg-Y20]|uniref:type II toxin-antitoxin system PemK/MazF family toxin n=1 Tax=unclassified Arthrobacter TaxID=235627 RepID=UPI001D1341CE|nr:MULTISPECIES: type II toxin-antitoxin system PemK/MazF family toxin [unclassified Arthrobacter]MCC3274837.1 type II toxin-antitoxin system PemK/MazF family toxin [Arthrobacter sp. zg-Y20]MDK1314993.1 type II toxin-antitoxin system PemK/MazF family toxin [Arthrobacter sp. zg.Y20]WIB04844.1 type II toxin-antitoxin system PemK/MazF family toxin [Arthrobacter sp. zg-Y20]